MFHKDGDNDVDEHKLRHQYEHDKEHRSDDPIDCYCDCYFTPKNIGAMIVLTQQLRTQSSSGLQSSFSASYSNGNNKLPFRIIVLQNWKMHEIRFRPVHHGPWWGIHYNSETP